MGEIWYGEMWHNQMVPHFAMVFFRNEAICLGVVVLQPEASTRTKKFSKILEDIMFQL